MPERHNHRFCSCHSCTSSHPPGRWFTRNAFMAHQVRISIERTPSSSTQLDDVADYNHQAFALTMIDDGPIPDESRLRMSRSDFQQSRRSAPSLQLGHVSPAPLCATSSPDFVPISPAIPTPAPSAPTLPVRPRERVRLRSLKILRNIESKIGQLCQTVSPSSSPNELSLAISQASTLRAQVNKVSGKDAFVMDTKQRLVTELGVLKETWATLRNAQDCPIDFNTGKKFSILIISL